MKANRPVLAALVLAVMAGVTACERSDSLGQLTGPVTRQQGLLTNNISLLKHARTVSTEKVCSVKPIGAGGGVLVFDGGYIQISYLAVTTPTIFCAQNNPGTDVIRVDLSAYRAADGVPVSQFLAPVFLKVDLNDALGITDWNQLVIVYLNPNGTLEPMPTVVNKSGKSVTGTLLHFSDYSTGQNRNDTTPTLP